MFLFCDLIDNRLPFLRWKVINYMYATLRLTSLCGNQNEVLKVYFQNAQNVIYTKNFSKSLETTFSILTSLKLSYLLLDPFLKTGVTLTRVC